jgi:glutaminyl-peptide cyclotransferase
MMRLAIIVFIISMANLGCETVMPIFDEKKAFNHLLAQCEFGPRNPGSDGHIKTKKYILNFVQDLADTVIIQDFSFESALENKNYNGTNIIARFNPMSKTQILIGAHWDTRPQADQDKDSRNYEKPILGANDGASGVAVLLELADLLNDNPPDIGINFAFFDAEDSGVSGENESYCQGSIFFAKNLPINNIKEAIILDMVGDKQLSLPIERNSLNFHSQLIRKLWDRAKILNLDAFKGVVGPSIYDDHVPLFQYAGIPSIDIIDFRYPNAFKNYWHTVDDTPENCSAKSLGQVGMLMVDYIFNRRFYHSN